MLKLNNKYNNIIDNLIDKILYNHLYISIFISAILILAFILLKFPMSIILKSSEMFSYYPFILFVIWIPLLFFNFFHFNHKNNNLVIINESMNNNIRKYFIISLICSFMFYIYKFYIFPYPQGFDTPRYAYFAQKLNHKISITSNYNYGVILFIYVLIKILFWVDIERVMIIFSILLGLIYTASYFYFILNNTQNVIMSFITSIILPTWFSTIQLNIGLY